MLFVITQKHVFKIVVNIIVVIYIVNYHVYFFI